MRMFWVYIMSNFNRTVVYTGVTGNLTQRVTQHRASVGSTFSARYKTHFLVYFETFLTAKEAIRREKQIKGWTRIKKNRLIESVNPNWRDLTDTT
jgi:putative endonuclease